MARYLISPGGDVVLALTFKEAEGLLTLAGKGAENVYSTSPTSRPYLKGSSALAAAERARATLRSAVVVAAAHKRI